MKGNTLMIYLIAGSTHTGKTYFADQLMKKFHISSLSIDHLKMGLIRSGIANFTADTGDEIITPIIWPVIREIIKTAIENDQDLIIEGCYIPSDFQNDFEPFYLNKIHHLFLIMTDAYIKNNFDKIIRYANVIEKRIDDSYLNMQNLIKENQKLLNECLINNLNYYLIDQKYNLPIELF